MRKGYLFHYIDFMFGEDAVQWWSARSGLWKANEFLSLSHNRELTKPINDIYNVLAF